MGTVTHLWKPRSDHPLPRHWIAYGERILIDGACRNQTGILSMRPGDGGALQARLQVAGGEFGERVEPGHDLAIWINGLRLFVDLIAVEEQRLLASFRVPSGANVSVTVQA